MHIGTCNKFCLEYVKGLTANTAAQASLLAVTVFEMGSHPIFECAMSWENVWYLCFIR